jgi:hypothetical protein
VTGLRTIRAPAEDPDIKTMVGRLDLERYKAAIKRLTAFGDRRQGTKRNRDAVDWIEAQLTSIGCTHVERLRYIYTTPARGRGAATAPDPAAAPDAATARGVPPQGQPVRTGPGASTEFGLRGPTGVYQPPATAGGPSPNAPSAGGGRRGLLFPPVTLDPRLRELNDEPAVDGPRDEVYCTKIGATRPDEMYIVSAHMDGHGWGEAANDDASGTALVMELARVFSASDVVTDRSIRFILWNNEETGLNGARAYVSQRKDLQGKEDPAGSGRYPEPTWLGVIQHDMMLWDHGMPQAQFNPDGSPMLDANGHHYHAVSTEQRPEADINIEFQSQAVFAEAAMKLAFVFKAANDRYATHYPAQVGPHMTNTDSEPFMDLVPAISIRENERGREIQAGWDPNWHRPSDVFTTYSDKDFLLGLNAAQTTLAAVAQLSGARLNSKSTASRFARRTGPT